MSDIVKNRLRAAREQAGISQGQVARLLGMHRPTISQIEAGQRRVSADEIKRFAEIYEVGVAWLTGAEAAEASDVDDRVQLAARELASLKPDDLERVMRLLRSLRGKPEGKP